MINNRENVLLFEEKVVYLQTKKFGSAYYAVVWCAHTNV